MSTPPAIMSISTSEAAVLFLLFLLLVGWSLNRFRWLRWATAALIALHLCTAILQAEEPTKDPPAAEKTAEAATETATLEDGERDWGRDPGIGTTLSTPSMVIAGAASAVVIGLVAWLVSYRKPDGTVHPYDEG